MPGLVMLGVHNKEVEVTAGFQDAHDFSEGEVPLVDLLYAWDRL